MKFDFLDIGTCDFDTSADTLTANPTNTNTNIR